MRLAIVTDIQGNLPAVEAVAHDLARCGVARVVNLGHRLSGPLLPLETARYLMARDWFHLGGNHERQCRPEGPAGRRASDAYARSVLTSVERDWIASLRPAARYGAAILLRHGTPRSDLER